MKKLLTAIAIIASISAFGAGTNTITVSIDLTDAQAEQLKFLKRYWGSTLTSKQFATNVISEIKWTPGAEFILSQRRDRVVSAVGTVPDDSIKAVESALGLPDLTNSVAIGTNGVPAGR